MCVCNLSMVSSLLAPVDVSCWSVAVQSQVAQQSDIIVELTHTHTQIHSGNLVTSRVKVRRLEGEELKRKEKHQQ